MPVLIFISLFLFLPFTVCAQNLVPNPGFEDYEKIICQRYSDKNDFSNALINWHSPTNGTPDMYCLKGAIECRNYDYQGVLHQQLPRTGNVMVGLNMPGEYIQTKLIKSLTPGRKYYVEFWVICSPTASFVSNNIGIYFSENTVSNYSYAYTPLAARLSFSPQINCDTIISNNQGKWHKISGVFEAKSAAKYITVGNFFSASQTSYKRVIDDAKTEYSYYLIDDILVQEAENKQVVLYDSLMRFKTGATWELKNISFKSASSELVNSSFKALDNLAETMQSMPHLKIEIAGHTDNTGSESVNSELSAARAQAVKNYLVSKRISGSRIECKGYGSSRPVYQNDTEEGRSKNRRVEVTIIKN